MFSHLYNQRWSISQRQHFHYMYLQLWAIQVCNHIYLKKFIIRPPFMKCHVIINKPWWRGPPCIITMYFSNSIIMNDTTVYQKDINREIFFPSINISLEDFFVERLFFYFNISIWKIFLFRSLSIIDHITFWSKI